MPERPRSPASYWIPYGWKNTIGAKWSNCRTASRSKRFAEETEEALPHPDTSENSSDRGGSATISGA
jgi:hypothetical protein